LSHEILRQPPSLAIGNRNNRCERNLKPLAESLFSFPTLCREDGSDSANMLRSGIQPVLQSRLTVFASFIDLSVWFWGTSLYHWNFSLRLFVDGKKENVDVKSVKQAREEGNNFQLHVHVVRRLSVNTSGQSQLGA